MEKRLRIFVALCLIAFLLTTAGCKEKEKETADVSVKKYCDVMLSFDLDAMKKLPQVQNPGQLHIDMLNIVITNYKNAVGTIFNDQQILRTANAALESFSKVSTSTRVLSKEKNKATVEVTVGVLNLDTVNLIEIAYYIDSKYPYATEAEALEYVTQECINRIKAVNPSRTATFTVNCTYDSKAGAYVIDDLPAFTRQLVAKVVGY